VVCAGVFFGFFVARRGPSRRADWEWVSRVLTDPAYGGLNYGLGQEAT